MTCEELRDHYEMYALGTADEPERSDIRDHLNRQCERCTAGMKQARRITALISGTVPEAQPSPRLRRRILASAGFEQPQRFAWLAPLLGAAAMLSLVAAVYFGGRQRQSVEEVARLRNELRSQTIEAGRLTEAFEILNTPGAVQASFGEGAPQPPKGKVFISPGRGVLLIASNLPPAPAGKTYEMWIIPKGGKPAAAGIFQSTSDGTAMHVQRGAVDPQTVAAVAVTVENEGGATEPTLPPLFAAALQ